MLERKNSICSIQQPVPPLELPLPHPPPATQFKGLQSISDDLIKLNQILDNITIKMKDLHKRQDGVESSFNDLINS
jgi:hypothetical protein